jgi:hypothetical protein
MSPPLSTSRTAVLSEAHRSSSDMIMIVHGVLASFVNLAIGTSDDSGSLW